MSITRGGVPERPKGADCKSAVIDFEGSNPSPTTILKQYLDNMNYPWWGSRAAKGSRL